MPIFWNVKDKLGLFQSPMSKPSLLYGLRNLLIIPPSSLRGVSVTSDAVSILLKAGSPRKTKNVLLAMTAG